MTTLYPALAVMRLSMQVGFRAYEAQMGLGCAMLHATRQMQHAVFRAALLMPVTEVTTRPQARRATGLPPAPRRATVNPAAPFH